MGGDIEPPRVGGDQIRVKLIVRSSVRIEVFVVELRSGQQCRPRRDGLRPPVRSLGEQVREEAEIDEDAGWAPAHREGDIFVVDGLLAARRGCIRAPLRSAPGCTGMVVADEGIVKSPCDRPSCARSSAR